MKIFPFRGIFTATKMANQVNAACLHIQHQAGIDYQPTYVKERLEQCGVMQDTVPHYYGVKVTTASDEAIGIIAAVDRTHHHASICLHEEVIAEQSAFYQRSLAASGVQVNPILLFHQDEPLVEAYLGNYLRTVSPFLTLVEKETTYSLWRLPTTSKLSRQYAAITQYFMADGHHRFDALGYVPGASSFLALLLGAKQVRAHGMMRVYHRVPVSIKERFLNFLQTSYSAKEVACRAAWQKYDGMTAYVAGKYFLWQAASNCVAKSNFLRLLTKHIPEHGGFTTSKLDWQNNHTLQGYGEIIITIPPTPPTAIMAMPPQARLPPHATYLTPKLPNDLVALQLKEPVCV